MTANWTSIERGREGNRENNVQIRRSHRQERCAETGVGRGLVPIHLAAAGTTDSFTMVLHTMSECGDKDQGKIEKKKKKKKKKAYRIKRSSWWIDAFRGA